MLKFDSKERINLNILYELINNSNNDDKRTINLNKSE